MTKTLEEKNSSGEELLSRLRNCAIGLSLGELSDATYDSKDYTVTLFYEDTQADKVWLCTGEDMFHALLEYVSRGRRMRAFAIVRPNNTNESLSSPAAATTISNDKSTTTTMAETSTATTQTTVPIVAESVLPTPPTAEGSRNNSNNKDLVDAVTDLLTCVAVTVNAGLNSANPTAVIKQAKKASKEAAKQAKKMSKEAVKQVKKASKMEAAAAAAAPPVTTEKNDPPVSTPEPEPQERTTEKKEPPVSTPEQVEKPFIHGRHTCDQCLTTPIVGKRYHAVSLPDYDLCEKCFQNYDGKEIQFAEDQLGE